MKPLYETVGDDDYDSREGDRTEKGEYVILIMGFLCVLLVVGKIARVKLPVIRTLLCPSCVWGGIIGLTAISSLNAYYDHRDQTGTGRGRFIPKPFGDLNNGLMEISHILIAYVFSALVLGFGRVSKRGYTLKNTFRAVWHEAVPQVLYGQVLAWGQVCVALLVNLAFREQGVFPDASPYLGLVCTLGFEAGREVDPGHEVHVSLPRTRHFIQLAELVGMVAALFLGLILLNIRGRLQHRLMPPLMPPPPPHRAPLQAPNQYAAGWASVTTSSSPLGARLRDSIGESRAELFLRICSCRRACKG
jgi:hypothetical protein